MTTGTSVWAQLAVSNAIQYAVPFIDANSLQPTIDSGSTSGVPTGGGFCYVPAITGAPFSGWGALQVGTAGDFSGVDAINSGGQIDSYVPTTNQAPGTVGAVPGHSVSASRGTRYIPLNIQNTDLLGEYGGYGYISQAGVFSYQKLAGLSLYAAGASVTYPGGEIRFGTKADVMGVFTEWLKLSNIGNLEPMVTGTSRLGSAAKGFAALTLDYTNSATIGAVTINKPAGSGNIALGASSVVVTNSLVTANSLVLAWLMANDGTLTSIKSVVPAGGSFTVTGNANATGNTKFGFLVINTDS
jgi:hypothetical protein